MKLTREAERQFSREYMIDLDPAAAAQRCGVMQSPRNYGLALLRRARVANWIHDEMEARAIRLRIDADFVLSELMRQYVRLCGMLGHSIAALYAEDGSMLPVAAWPAIWQEKLVNEIHVEELSARSHDGVQGGDSKSWDKVGRVSRIKRESTLQIERQIREVLELIGQHMRVKAFEQPITAGNLQVNNFSIRWMTREDLISEKAK